MSRDLSRLDPAFLSKLQEAVNTAKAQGVHMVPYEAERDVWRQAKLWRQSRSGSQVRSMIDRLRGEGAVFLSEVLAEVGPQSGPWATNALPGQSWHQWGLACDLYWDSNGEAPGGVEWSKMEGYKKFAIIARDIGLTSGFFWRSRDAVHVQLPVENAPPGTLREISDAMRLRYRA